MKVRIVLYGSHDGELARHEFPEGLDDLNEALIQFVRDTAFEIGDTIKIEEVYE